MTRRPLGPGALLFWLAPACALLLTGMRPPGEYLQPHALFVFLIVYGCGALAARELAWRWRPGGLDETGRPHPIWPRLGLLGLTFGLLVNGVMLKDAVSGDWTRLGLLADAQRGLIGGINLTWTLLAMLHYAVLGVLVPTLLVELARPAAMGRPWLTERRLRWCWRLFLTAVLLGALSSGPAPPGPYAAVCLSALWLLGRCRHWRPRRPRLLPPQAPWRCGLASFLATGWFASVVEWGSRGEFHPLLKLRILLLALTMLLVARYIAGRTARRVAGGWSPRHHFAVAAGVLGLFIVLAPQHEADLYHAETVAGMSLVGLVALGLLWRLKRQVAARLAEGQYPLQLFAAPAEPPT